MQRRKVTYKLYPSARQAALLMDLLRQHKDLWNAALEERIDAWRKAGIGITYAAQCKSLTEVRRALPEDWAQSNCSAQQITLKRLDKAFQAFFARCKRGEKPGFPRFKSLRRMPGIGFKGHGDGLRFSPNLAADPSAESGETVRWSKHGSLRLQGIGHIPARGQARSAGTIKSCELLYKNDEWHLSVTLECADAAVARRRTASVAMGADWGVSRLLTIVRTDGARGEVTEEVDNPRWFQESKVRLVELDQAVSRKKRCSRSWRKAGRARSAYRSKMARRRHDHQHQLSARIAARAVLFASEKLSFKNMTASAAGTVEEPGKNVRQKAGLNREILDTAPAALLQKIAYKVPETGGLFLEAPTRKLKASQTCPPCGAVKKKALSERWHCCAACGHEEDRDSAAARVVLRWALGTSAASDLGFIGQELSAAL